jgi:hypothetical protein
MMDDGSGMNVVSYDALLKMHYTDADIQVTRSTCMAYDSHETVPTGTVKLPITVGPVTVILPFFVLDKDFTYNMILGRPWIHRMHAVPYTLY